MMRSDDSEGVVVGGTLVILLRPLCINVEQVPFSLFPLNEAPHCWRGPKSYMQVTLIGLPAGPH